MILTRRTFAASLLAAPAVLRGAKAALPQLPDIAPEDAAFTQPGAPLYQQTLPAYNLRTELKPVLRILVKTPRGLAQAVDWVRQRDVPFALRSGGHSFEGLSQSSAVVIDTRLLNDIEFDDDRNIVTVGAGTTLGDIYRFAGARGLAFPGGSCPTVGIAGHALGGGFGLLARSRGLACDNLEAVDLVDAEGRLIRADADRNADLFWASRGGGGGTFGAVARLHLRLEPIWPLTVFAATWALPLPKAVELFAAWQDWAPRAPDSITGIFKLAYRRDDRIELHIAGQSVGPANELQRELRGLAAVAAPEKPATTATMSFLHSVNHFSGGWSYETGYSKGKSDFITRPLDRAGIEALLGGLASLPPGEVIAICDAYGGAIDRIDGGETAFAYRAGTQFCIQYYTSWAGAAAGARRMADLRRLYATMRPWSGGAYVNYCDRDLDDWKDAYWRQNLDRLQAIKSRFDPENLFHHAQSVR